MLFQTLYHRFCFLAPGCFCHNDIKVKVFVFVKTLLTFWSFQILILYNSFFYLPVLQSRLILKILCVLVLLADICFFHLYNEGDEVKGSLFLEIYLGSFFVFLVLYVIVLFLLDFKFKKWTHDVFKGNLIVLLFYLNYAFMRCFFSYIPKILQFYLSETLAENFLYLILTLYCNILTFLIQKFCWYYYQTLLHCSKNKKMNDFRLSTQIRFCCCYYVAINTVLIVRMKLENWGGWLLFLSYIGFIIKCYTNFDALLFVFQRIGFFFKKKKISKTIQPQDLLEFRKIFSGCCLDVQFICVSRFLVMFFWGKWSFGPGVTIFYRDCQFNIADTFQMKFWGVIAIIATNLLIVSGTIAYMSFKRVVLLFYKTNVNLMVNCVMFFWLHFYLENEIQSFSIIFFDYNYNYLD